MESRRTRNNVSKPRKLKDSCSVSTPENLGKLSAKKLAQELALARTKNDKSFISVVKRHLVDNFRNFSQDDSFLEMTLDELKDVLITFKSSFSKAEFSRFKHDNTILDMVLRWIYYFLGTRSKCFLTLSTLINFDEISQKCRTFIIKRYDIKCNSKKTSLKKCIEDHFHKSVGLPSYLDRPTTLYVYVNYHQEWSSLSPVKILSLDMRGERPNWEVLSSESDSTTSILQSVVVNEELYFLYSSEFKACTSLEAWHCGGRKLTVPPCKTESFSMCANRNNIYGYNGDIHNRSTYRIPSNGTHTDSDTLEKLQTGIYHYNIETDKWLALPALKRKIAGACVTVDDNLLYVIGGEQSRYVQVYDHRTPNWIEIPTTSYAYNKSVACTLNGNVYMSDGDVVEKYNSEASKWEAICIGSPSPSPAKKPRSDYRRCMLPHADCLWIFTYGTDKCFNRIIDPQDATNKEYTLLENAIDDAAYDDYTDYSDCEYDSYRRWNRNDFDKSLDFVGIMNAVVFTCE